jgi:hypothetical protein
MFPNHGYFRRCAFQYLSAISQKDLSEANKKFKEEQKVFEVVRMKQRQRFQK